MRDSTWLDGRVDVLAEQLSTHGLSLSRAAATDLITRQADTVS